MMILSFYFSVQSKEKNVLRDYALLALVLAVFMILVLVFVVMISLIMKQNGYSTYSLFGYTQQPRHDPRYIDNPLLERTNEIILLHRKQKHPPR